ncbi:MAG: hypothetical protein ACK4M4_06390 [Flavobacterium sp.]
MPTVVTLIEDASDISISYHQTGEEQIDQDVFVSFFLDFSIKNSFFVDKVKQYSVSGVAFFHDSLLKSIFIPPPDRSSKI